MVYYFTKSETKQILPVNVTFNKFKSSNEQRVVTFAHHMHDVLEILAVKKGTLNVTLNKSEKYILNAGDCVVVNPFVLHFGEVSVGNDAEYYGFTLNLDEVRVNNGNKHHTNLGSVLRYGLEFDCFIEKNNDLLALFEDIYTSLREQSLKSELYIISCVYNVLAILFDGHINESKNKKTNKSTEFMRDVSKYLSENFQNDISTASISAEFYCDTSYFCHKFRKNFGDSFLNYLCMYRIIKATELYKNTGLLITEIASKVGFSDYSYFSRSFKKYMGITPSKYFGDK